MAVPKFHEFFPAFLQCLSDGNAHHMKEIQEFCVAYFSLTDEDLRELTPSGSVSRVKDRIGWARTYLKKAGLIQSSARSVYQLTEEGKNAVAKYGAEKITLSFLNRYDSFRAFYGHDVPPEKNVPSTLSIENAGQDPKEQIEFAIEQIHSALAEDLMQQIMEMESYDFEKLVVLLLEKMGYGKPITTKKSGDEGIDGFVKADQFGFDSIYVQAKQWKPESIVGRPEVQRFLGAMAGQGATKGLFFTTTRFSKEAEKYAERQLQQKIVLVDGEKLTKLMIAYNLGVSIEKTYEVKHIDLDFFHDDF